MNKLFEAVPVSEKPEKDGHYVTFIHTGDCEMKVFKKGEWIDGEEMCGWLKPIPPPAKEAEQRAKELYPDPECAVDVVVELVAVDRERAAYIKGHQEASAMKGGEKIAAPVSAENAHTDKVVEFDHLKKTPEFGGIEDSPFDKANEPKYKGADIFSKLNEMHIELDAAHTNFAKLNIAPDQYNPISHLLARTKLDLIDIHNSVSDMYTGLSVAEEMLNEYRDEKTGFLLSRKDIAKSAHQEASTGQEGEVKLLRDALQQMIDLTTEVLVRAGYDFPTEEKHINLFNVGIGDKGKTYKRIVDTIDAAKQALSSTPSNTVEPISTDTEGQKGGSC